MLRLRWNNLRLLANIYMYKFSLRQSFQWLDLLFCLFLSEAQMKRCVALKGKIKFQSNLMYLFFSRSSPLQTYILRKFGDFLFFHFAHLQSRFWDD